MKRGSVDSHFLVFFATATLAAHSNHKEKGFRQKDVRFLIELVSNWMDSTLEGPSILVHNAQIARYLESLVRSGMARKTAQKGILRYRLTRAGLVGLLQGMVDRDRHLPLEQFYYLYYFVRNYGERVRLLAESEGAMFPKALRLELDALRDPAELLSRQKRYIDRAIAKLDIRIEEGLAAAELATRLFAKGVSVSEVVKEVQQKYPYELNNQKPMPDLFEELPDAVRRAELVEGARQRAACLWTPLREHLSAYRRILEGL